MVAPIEPDGSMRLYFAKSETIETVSASDILRDDFDAGVLAGKILFIGTSAAGLKDIRATPLDQATPGVEVHIQTVQQLISGTYLQRPIWVQLYESLATILIGLVLIVMIARYSIVPGLVIYAIALAGGAVSWQQFSQNLILIDPATPALTVFATLLTAAFLTFFADRARKTRST